MGEEGAMELGNKVSEAVTMEETTKSLRYIRFDAGPLHCCIDTGCFCYFNFRRRLVVGW